MEFLKTVEVIVLACTYFNGVPLSCQSARTHMQFAVASVQAQVCETQARNIAYSFAKNISPMMQVYRGRCIYGD